MATEKNRPRNPYVAGRALGQERGFLGRKDIFDLIETELSSPDRNAIVLFGQRRIGKTSILLQLQRRLSSQPFSVIYFDLMDRARKPMGQVLFELASTIAAEVGTALAAGSDAFDDEGCYFREKFLPTLYQALGGENRPVLLLDEFDVLDVAAEEQLPSPTAAKAFFPFLRQLMEAEPRLGFVFVVGRKAEDLSIDVKAAFKAARYKRVSVLDEKSARELVTTAQRQKTLAFTQAAVNRILALTSGHPYFTQLICQLLWDDAYAGNPQGVPTIEPPTVEAIVPKALEAGENIFEWIWDGLPSAERVIFAAIAEETNEQAGVSEDKLLDILQRHGIRILTRELELAPDTLVNWEMLRETDGGYGFFIELMRRWVAARKPLPKVKDELDRVIPLADQLYQTGNSFYRQGDAENAANQLRQALTRNPNHFKARLLLGQVLRERGELDEALRELEEAYRYDEDGARYPLIQTLLVKGEGLEREGGDNDALMIYERVLKLSPREKVAQERQAAIWVKRGDEALMADDLETALAAYQEAGVQEKIAEIGALKLKRDRARKATEAEDNERREEWEKAIEIYQRLVRQDPEEKRWHEALARVKNEQGLSQRYAEGHGAFGQRKWSQAQRALANVVHTQPDYKDAADLLARAVREQRAAVEPRAKVEQRVIHDEQDDKVISQPNITTIKLVAFGIVFIMSLLGGYILAYYVGEFVGGLFIISELLSLPFIYNWIERKWSGRQL